MLDTRARRLLAPTLDGLAAGLDARGVSPLMVTATGWGVGLLACLAAASGHWWVALPMWLTNRLLDGLDGPLARRRGATDLGGFLDIVADFSIYAGFVLAVAIARPDARLACLALLVAYYVSGTAFLAFSSLLERRGGAAHSGRSLVFLGGLAEGTETIVVYILICVFPAHAALSAWAFTAAVAITAIQRIVTGVAVLRLPSTREPARAKA